MSGDRKDKKSTLTGEIVRPATASPPAPAEGLRPASRGVVDAYLRGMAVRADTRLKEEISRNLQAETGAYRALVDRDRAREELFDIETIKATDRMGREIELLQAEARHAQLMREIYGKNDDDEIEKLRRENEKLSLEIERERLKAQREQIRNPAPPFNRQAIIEKIEDELAALDREWSVRKATATFDDSEEYRRRRRRLAEKLERLRNGEDL